MNDSQHDAVTFFLGALFLGAIVAAVTVLLTSCGGSPFQSLDETHDAAGPSYVFDALAPSDDASEAGNDVVITIRTLPDADANAIPETGAIADAALNIPEAAPVEASTNCKIDNCKNVCMFGNTPCCTTEGACGCTNFGPGCI